MTPLEQAGASVAPHLEAIAALFVGQPKITILVRPDVGEGRDADFVMTSDTLATAIEALERREAYDIGPRQVSADRPKRRIPIRAARAIADEYGYDQVVVYGRRVGEAPAPFGEHLTTYGVDPTHCEIAARIGRTLKRLMGWGA